MRAPTASQLASDARWLASQYGPEVEIDEFYALLDRVGVRRERVSNSNGVSTVRYELTDGRMATHHSGMYAAFYFVSTD